MIGKGMILGCLFLGFLLIFRRIRWLYVLNRLLKQTKDSVDEAARQRMLNNRKSLLSLHREYGLWFWIEQELHYSGIKRRFPTITAEKWLLGNIVAAAAVALLSMVSLQRWWGAFLGLLLLVAAEALLFTIGKAKAMKSVDRNLLKFLDFLGNYSVTAGEVTGVFKQVSKYMEEPLKSVLDECCYEAQTTGDMPLALLSMAEKVEHPQFKELVQNMEISIRYCADFTTLVNSSRRTVREYLRMGGERREMLREAAVNMVFLLALSGFVLVTVNGLIEASIWHILVDTWPGRVGMSVIGLVLILFLRQVYRINR